jgi:hypothetical protein
MKIKIEVQYDRPGPESFVSKDSDPNGITVADKSSEISFNESDEQIAKGFSKIAVVDTNLEFRDNSERVNKLLFLIYK